MNHSENGQPQVSISLSPDYRETYANSVQVQASVSDFFLTFGVTKPLSPQQVNIENRQGIFLSPQQTKALCNALGQHLLQYEQAFGVISLEPLPVQGQGPVH